MLKCSKNISGLAALVFVGLIISYYQQQKLYIFNSKFRSSCPTIDEMVFSESPMDDECLINYIAENRVTAPSSLPYNLAKTVHENITDPLSSYMIDSQAPWIEALLLVETLVPKRKRTFLECGALDGVTFSTTIHLERFLNWSGILVEADPIYYGKIRHRNRKAYAVKGCASLTRHPQRIKFNHVEETHKLGNLTNFNPGTGFISSHGDKRLVHPFWEKSTEFEVLCFPMYSILCAVNMTTVDLFVLDVEGAELAVLKTIPFDRADISVIVCEMNGKTKDQNMIIVNYLTSVGYAFHGFFSGGIHPLDAILIKSELYDPVKLKQSNNSVDVFRIVTGKKDGDRISQEDLNAFSAV